MCHVYSCLQLTLVTYNITKRYIFHKYIAVLLNFSWEYILRVKRDKLFRADENQRVIKIPSQLYQQESGRF